MKREAKEKYAEISEAIEQAEKAELDRILDDIASGSKKRLIRIRNNESDIEMIYLRCRRIAIVLEYFRFRTPKQNAVLKKDCDDVIKMIAFNEYRLNTDKANVFEAADCVLALSDGGISKKDVVGVFSKQHPNDGTIYGENNEDTPELLLNIASYLLKRGEEELALRAMRYLVECSRRRAGEGSPQHREIVASIALKLDTKYPQFRYDICAAENEKFVPEPNYEYTEEDSDFYWALGLAAVSLEKNEEAYEAFDKSYGICQKLLGEDNWFTQLVCRERAVLAIMLGKNIKENVDKLRIFLEKLQNGKFSEIMDGKLALIYEAKTLYVILRFAVEGDECRECKPYLDRYGELCDVFGKDSGEVCINRRFYFNALGLYWMTVGELFKAEQWFKTALEEDNCESGTENEPSDAVIKLNLCTVAMRLNDMERLCALLSELEEMKEEDDSEFTDRCRYIMQFDICALYDLGYSELDEETAEQFKEDIDVLKKDIIKNEVSDKRRAAEAAVSVYMTAKLLITSDFATEAEREEYMRLIEHVTEIYAPTLEPSRVAAINVMTAAIMCLRHDYRAASGYITAAEEFADSTEVMPVVLADLYTNKAVIMFALNEEQRAAESAEKALECIEKQRCEYVKYCNDKRLIGILTSAQSAFLVTYGVLREVIKDDWELYEFVIRNKALASLTGKERNRVIQSGRMDTALAKKIRAAQDRLAEIEARGVFVDSSADYEAEREKLREMEAEFAEEFPEDTVFTDITAEAVKRKIPCNSVVVEYSLYFEAEKADSPNEETKAAFDVFVIQKTETDCSIRRVVIPNASDIVERTGKFNMILQKEAQHEADSDDLDEKERLRASLYHDLLEPVEGFMAGFETVWLAPDNVAVNLPFDVLGRSKRDIPGDRHNFVIIECSRDFLFGSDGAANGSGSLIIGNPKYLLNEKTISPKAKQDSDKDKKHESGGNERMVSYADLRNQDICPLPFSEIEANMVSLYCGESCFVGAEASKNHLLNCGTKRNIHIATHGFFDLEEETNSLYSSCLLFAGAGNWLKNGNATEKYGNGIVTADEISRMDCRNVELVVLSACFGGMNDAVLAKGFCGMVGGFAAAGVKYVISCLWTADDFASAVLMAEFYRQYKGRKLSPPAALRAAKKYLRRVTIQELAEKNWFDIALKNGELSSEAREAVLVLSNMPPKFAPFNNEIYWAGFTCFRCN